MKYNTYKWFKDCIHDAKVKLEDDWRASTNFYRFSSNKDNNSAYDVFREEYNKLTEMEKELLKSAQSVYKNHPDIEMRKFWGIEGE